MKTRPPSLVQRNMYFTISPADGGANLVWGREEERESRAERGKDLFSGVLASCLTDRMIVRTDSWEGFSPRRCQAALRWDYFWGGVALFLRVNLCAHVHVRLPGEFPRPLHLCVMEVKGLVLLVPKTTLQRRWFWCTLCSIWSHSGEEGAGREDRCHFETPVSFLSLLSSFRSFSKNMYFHHHSFYKKRQQQLKYHLKCSRTDLRWS